MKLQDQMFEALKGKELFNQAKDFAFDYADEINNRPVFPSKQALNDLEIFNEKMPTEIGEPEQIIQLLHEYGSPATVAQTAGRYFGFVNGGAVPVSVAAKWLSDFWDQNAGLYLISPINSKLEYICEQWLKEIFNLPKETVAGFVSGTSSANLCGLVAARDRLLKNMGWDVNENGLNGAPPIKVVAHRQIHAAIKKALSIIGFGYKNITWVNSDKEGRVLLEEMPAIDASTLVILQVGNANSGAFDPLEEICKKANEVGAWVHIDGAFGLWAAATTTLSHLTKGMELASSWSVDGHKTLNTPYDSGIILCKDGPALVSALQSTGEYIIYSEKKDSMLYTPEMSKRARAVELWATMKYLGKEGINEMVTGFYNHAKQFEKDMRSKGFRIMNEVVFNQVMIACDTEELTNATLANLQNSGECWCGGSRWHEEAVIRVSICSWATTEADMQRTVNAFVKARDQVLVG